MSGGSLPPPPPPPPPHHHEPMNDAALQMSRASSSAQLLLDSTMVSPPATHQVHHHRRFSSSDTSAFNHSASEQGGGGLSVLHSRSGSLGQASAGQQLSAVSPQIGGGPAAIIPQRPPSSARRHNPYTPVTPLSPGVHHSLVSAYAATTFGDPATRSSFTTTPVLAGETSSRSPLDNVTQRHTVMSAMPVSRETKNVRASQQQQHCPDADSLKPNDHCESDKTPADMISGAKRKARARGKRGGCRIAAAIQRRSNGATTGDGIPGSAGGTSTSETAAAVESQRKRRGRRGGKQVREREVLLGALQRAVERTTAAATMEVTGDDPQSRSPPPPPPPVVTSSSSSSSYHQQENVSASEYSAGPLQRDATLPPPNSVGQGTFAGEETTTAVE